MRTVFSAVLVISFFFQTKAQSQITGTTGGNSTSAQTNPAVNTHTTLPLTLTSFSVTRIRSRVDIKWQILFEASSKGFSIQRKTDKEWETVAFLPSKSHSGNSSVPVAYEYSDVNNFRGVSQYRLVESSLYGEGQASDTKQIRGENFLSKVIVYPNPSQSGKVNLVFERTTPKEITVVDLTGRSVYQTSTYQNNQLTIDLRNAGIYIIKIIEKESGELFQEKIVVQKP